MKLGRSLVSLFAASMVLTGPMAFGAIELNTTVLTIPPYDFNGLAFPEGTSTQVRVGAGGTISNDVENTLSDGFAYDPLNPLLTSPNLAFGDNRSFHGNGLPANDPLDLAYNLGAFIVGTVPTETVIAVDVWGRNQNQNRDDDFSLQLFTSAGSPVVSNLALPGGAAPFARTLFTLPAGTQVNQLLILGNNSDGGNRNRFTLQEIRVAAIPEPTRAVLLGMGGLLLGLRRRR